MHGEGSADAIKGGMTQAFILCPAVLLVMGANGDERRLLERLCHHLLLDVLQRLYASMAHIFARSAKQLHVESMHRRKAPHLRPPPGAADLTQQRCLFGGC